MTRWLILFVLGLVGIAMGLASILAIAGGLASLLRPSLLPGINAPWVLFLLGLMLAAPAVAALRARAWCARAWRGRAAEPRADLPNLSR